MILSEGKKQVPVKFYQDKYGTIYYESDFTNGTAPSLKDAFNEFSREDFIRDLYYYYDDIVDAKIGKFIPSIEDKTYKKMKYLGKLEIEVETTSIFKNSINSLNYLSKHKNEIPRHKNWIKDMKLAVNELFEPEKTNNDLICKHCGQIIPKNNYFEIYRKDAYHLECIWDKLINKNDSNSYENAIEYFYSLKKYIGNWPAYGYDIENDYLYDLSLVEHNKRINEANELIESINEVRRRPYC